VSQLPRVSGREVVKALRKIGYEFDRQRKHMSNHAGVVNEEGPNRATTSFTPVRNEADLVGTAGVRPMTRRLTCPANPPRLAPKPSCL
jgi:predicted RNA binding protein YcfA (HicA-like mRNA interferase family)